MHKTRQRNGRRRGAQLNKLVFDSLPATNTEAKQAIHKL